MEKQKADEIIKEYMKKIYGFAIKKSFSYDEAEELCSQIIYEVYTSLLNAEEIYNIEGYIYRISEHVYSKQVLEKKKNVGISFDGVILQNIIEDDELFSEEEFAKLRKEITFLTKIRREIVFQYYYEDKSISSIAKLMNIPEGTIKWHLNKARSELKENISMERKIGKLGMSPIEAVSFGHRGHTGLNEGPEFYLKDKLDLNIAYSVYNSPKSKIEISEELGVSLPFIEDKINILEENGFLVPVKANRYTTYVKFYGQNNSIELDKQVIKTQLEIANLLVEKYVPLVRKSIQDIKDVYIPTNNRELFEAAAIFYGVAGKCGISIKKDISKYYIKTQAGGEFIANIQLLSKNDNDEYLAFINNIPDYSACYGMSRSSYKYPSIFSWSTDSRLDSRTGGWKNNLSADYEYIYELINGKINENNLEDIEKINRLKERKLISEDLNINIMIVKQDQKDFFMKIPSLDESIKEQFANIAFDYATQVAKEFPSQMQDLIMFEQVSGLIGPEVAIMVMDILYQKGIFKSLTEKEKIAANLLMFSDVLPK